MASGSLTNGESSKDCAKHNRVPAAAASPSFNFTELLTWI
jgi:hypothetical protein